ncbi:MAG: hypothetical protein PVI30_24410 [Myxococcales bacterium]|jgi:hypothetical protein
MQPRHRFTRFHWLVVALLSATVCALPSTGFAQAADSGEPGADAPTPMASRADLGLVIGGKVGGGLGTGAVGATPVFELELGYALPPLNRAIEVFVAGQYSQPGTDGTASEPDPRLPGDGTFSYDITQQIMTVTLGGIYRLDLQNDLLMPYGGLGGRVYMLNTKTKGEVDGQAFGENEETQTDFGLVVMGGVDIFLGPGALLAELSFGWAAVDGFVLRDTDVGSLNLAVGYRVIL